MIYSQLRKVSYHEIVIKLGPTRRRLSTKEMKLPRMAEEAFKMVNAILQSVVACNYV